MFDSILETLPTRERLAAVAAGLLMRQSYACVSVDDVCKATGVQKGTFYHHFPSKVELALAAYDYMWSYARSCLDPCFSPAVPPLQRLENYAAAAYAHHNQTFEIEGKIYVCPIAGAGQEVGAEDTRVEAKVKELFENKIAYFESVVRDIPHLSSLSREDSKVLASKMLAYSTGTLYHAKVFNDPEVLKRDLLPGLQKLLT